MADLIGLGDSTANKTITQRKFFTKNTLGEELYFNTVDGYTGNSSRFSTNVVDGKFGIFKAMPMLNVNSKGVVSEQIRLTAATSSLQLGQFDGLKFSSTAEYRVTPKFDKNLKKTDVAQEPRVTLKAQKGQNSVSLVARGKYSQKNPQYAFGGGIVVLQRDFGKKVSTYLETVLPQETFTKGQFEKANFTFGLTYKL